MGVAAATFGAPASAALELGASAFKKAPVTKGVADETQALKVGRDFEAMFLSAMLQPVFDNISTDGILGGGSGEKMFRSLQVDEYGKAMSQAGGIGIAQAIQREILRMQEKNGG